MYRSAPNYIRLVRRREANSQASPTCGNAARSGVAYHRNAPGSHEPGIRFVLVLAILALWQMGAYIDVQVAHDLLKHVAPDDRTIIQVMFPDPLCGDLSTPLPKGITSSCTLGT